MIWVMNDGPFRVIAIGIGEELLNLNCKEVSVDRTRRRPAVDPTQGTGCLLAAMWWHRICSMAAGCVDSHSFSAGF